MTTERIEEMGETPATPTGKRFIAKEEKEEDKDLPLNSFRVFCGDGNSDSFIVKAFSLAFAHLCTYLLIILHDSAIRLASI